MHNFIIHIRKNGVLRDDKNTVRLPREHNIELQNPLEPQRLFGTGDPNLHHTYTTNKWSID